MQFELALDARRRAALGGALGGGVADEFFDRHGERVRGLAQRVHRDARNAALIVRLLRDAEHLELLGPFGVPRSGTRRVLGYSPVSIPNWRYEALRDNSGLGRADRSVEENLDRRCARS